MIQAKFTIDLKQVRKRIGDKVVLVQKKVALQVLEGVVNMTPVDTGRARGNWMLTIGRPAASYEWSKADPAGGGTIQAGAAAVSQLTKPGTVYITNNLPYILDLERGRSQQAPAGMVAVTLDRIGLQFKVT